MHISAHAPQFISVDVMDFVSLSVDFACATGHVHCVVQRCCNRCCVPLQHRVNTPSICSMDGWCHYTVCRDLHLVYLCTLYTPPNAPSDSHAYNTVCCSSAAQVLCMQPPKTLCGRSPPLGCRDGFCEHTVLQGVTPGVFLHSSQTYCGPVPRGHISNFTASTRPCTARHHHPSVLRCRLLTSLHCPAPPPPPPPTTITLTPPNTTKHYQVTSSAKKQRSVGSTHIHQTPEGAFFDLQRNAWQV